MLNNIAVEEDTDRESNAKPIECQESMEVTDIKDSSSVSLTKNINVEPFS